MTSDLQNTYLYDAEGRICAVKEPPVAGVTTMVGYLYDAEGNRIGKGSIQQWNCNTDTNGFSLTNEYLLGQNGEQVTELDGNGGWLHTNAYAGGQMIATYDPQGLHYQISDWLGNRRVQTNSSGAVELTWQNLPFGELTPSSTPGATEHHFTGKERDAESGNDYFGARYYNSATGRFLSPDSLAISKSLANPQSWNKYSYTFNNPVGLTDPDGHWPTDTHHQINSDVFSSILGAHGVSVLNAASDHIDCVSCGGQKPENSYQHFMLNGNELYGSGRTDDQVAAGYAASYNFIFSNIDKAVDSQLEYEAKGGKGNSDQALTYFGYAMHTVEDGTSPEHRGMQEWNGLGDPKDALDHSRRERRSAAAQTLDDEEALYEARIQVSSYYQMYQNKLSEARKKKGDEEAQ
jgi:RHS repeat-associated protein